MKSNEIDKTWISNILVRNNFLCLKQVYYCLTLVCVYITSLLNWILLPVFDVELNIKMQIWKETSTKMYTPF